MGTLALHLIHVQVVQSIIIGAPQLSARSRQLHLIIGFHPCRMDGQRCKTVMELESRDDRVVDLY